MARPGRLRSRVWSAAAQTAVQKYLQDPLADKILAGEIADGSVVRADEGDGALVLTPVTEQREAA